MFEKVNPAHPDKIADRIAGALVDMAYRLQENPRIAVEVLIGHERCRIIAETSVWLPVEMVRATVQRISGSSPDLEYIEIPQDERLAKNQKDRIRCGDNGIFKGMPITEEQLQLMRIASDLYEWYGTDGKYILDGNHLIVCQSYAWVSEIWQRLPIVFMNSAIINPLGFWTGGLDVDTGATNRKLGSDMGDSVTGGGLHGKDLSKADVSVNIYAFLKAQETGKPVELSCAIGDTMVDGKPYSEIVEIARSYIEALGGFEKFAEWGLIQ